MCEDYDFSSLAQAFAGEGECDIPASVEVVFVDKEGIRELNAKFRSVDKVTDVLSFPALDGIYNKPIRAEDFPFEIEDGVLNLGSVAVCTSVAKEQAEEYGHSYGRELYYLVTHGICHLLGCDHEREEDKAEMRAKEERVLAHLHLTL